MRAKCEKEGYLVTGVLKMGVNVAVHARHALVGVPHIHILIF